MTRRVRGRGARPAHRSDGALDPLLPDPQAAPSPVGAQPHRLLRRAPRRPDRADQGPAEPGDEAEQHGPAASTTSRARTPTWCDSAAPCRRCSTTRPGADHGRRPAATVRRRRTPRRPACSARRRSWASSATSATACSRRSPPAARRRRTRDGDPPPDARALCAWSSSSDATPRRSPRSTSTSSSNASGPLRRRRSPHDQWPEIEAALADVRTLATEALVSSFELVMSAEISKVFDRDLSGRRPRASRGRLQVRSRPSSRS